jgi:hypothetical protein
MYSLAQLMMTSPQAQPTAVLPLRNHPAARPHDLREILLAVVGAVSLAFATALFTTASGVGGADPRASAVVINSAGSYHDARVLKPGSRGSVVDI